VRSIPDHVYNKHDNCGTWCKVVSKKSTGLYQPKFVIKSEDLYNELLNIFKSYADNALKYCISASSQANESFNNTVCRKFPKTKSYSTSASGDIRVASTILTKNEGNCYLLKIKEALGVPVTRHLKDYATKLDKESVHKSIKSKSIEKKTRRLQLIAQRENLRKTLENKEGITYESNIAFKTYNVQDDSSYTNYIVENIPLLKNKCKIAFFDIETSSRERSADILQIAAVIDNYIFSVYIQPSQPIDKAASEINGLENVNGELYFNGKKVVTISILDALKAFHTFLSKFGSTCLLTAHNASFDVSFVIRECIKYSLIKDFKDVVYGFCDTLKLFRKKFSERKKKGMCTLSKLAQDLLDENISNKNFHEATYDVLILQKLVNKNLSVDDLFKNSTLFMISVNNSINKADTNVRAKTFIALKGTLSNYMITKMASSGITYNQLKEIYNEKGENSLISFLSEVKNKKPRITNNANILQKIVDYFKILN